MREIVDPTTPRNRLPFDQLPRGFVPWPQVVFGALESGQQKQGFRFTDEYVRRHLERAMLAYYYDGLDVACRPVDGGIEVLGVGWADS